MRYLVITMTALFLCNPARAADRVKLAVMPFNAQGVEKRVTTILDSLLAIEVDALGAYEVVSASDIKAILGLEGMKQSLGCTETSCAAELGGALGVDLMLTSVLGRLGDSILMTAKVIDVNQIRTIKRTSIKMANDENLFDRGVNRLVSKLFAGLPGVDKNEAAGLVSSTPPSGQPSASTATAAASSDSEQPRHQRSSENQLSAQNDTPTHLQQPVADEGDGISNFWWLSCASIAGVAGVLGVTTGLMAKGSEGIAQQGLEEGIVQDDVSPQEAAAQATKLATSSTSLFTSAIVFAAGAIPLYLWSKPLFDKPAPSASIAPLPLPGGAALVSTIHY